MTIITFFSPKGGAGRTTTVMAMASAILEEKKLKPAVIDMTNEAGPLSRDKPSSLTMWERKMVKCGYGFDDFRVEEVYDFESMIRADCECEFSDFAYQLVDTPKRPNALVLNKVERSDLIIVPFKNASEAALISKWLAKHLNKKQLIHGLATAIDTEDDYVLSRKAFAGFPVLQTYLPNVPIFERQPECGHLFGIEPREAHPSIAAPEEMRVRSLYDEGCRSAKHLWEEVFWIIIENEERKQQARNAIGHRKKVR
jgi:cellulose biosynthesis protein BcsQ